MDSSLSETEKKYVLDAYSQISDGFSKSRYNSWPGVTEFINGIVTNGKILDAGCGNGKNMLVREDLEWVGCDICPQLLDICRDRNLNVIEADVRHLPFESDSFDATISIAVIHHIDTFDGRLLAINELVRVTKHGGQIFIQVWEDTGLENHKFQKINDTGDYYVTWKTNDSVIKRFYHMFREEEIDNLVDRIIGVKLLKKYIEANNWIILLEKI